MHLRNSIDINLAIQPPHPKKRQKKNHISILDVEIVTFMWKGIDKAISYLIPERVASLLAACDL